MKKVTSALALAALVGTPAAAMANVEFGGDFDALYYNVQGTGDQATGFEQRMRLQSAFETDGGVSAHARLNLFNDRWTGDASGQNLDEAPFNGRGNRNVELDMAYVSIPMAGGSVNIGRQAANWNPMGLTTTDDRRDRISYVRPLGGGHTGIVLYDRRQAPDDTVREADGNLFVGALLGPLAEGVQYGFLVGQFTAGGGGAGSAVDADGNPVAGYGLRGATLLSPYIEGQAGDFNYGAGFHYLGDSHGGAFTEDTLAGYVHGGFQMTPEFKLDGQIFHAADGALVAGGYDTYSSLIHNSPDHDQSATRIGALNLGGLGTEGQDGISRTLAATRGTFEMMDWTFIGALGWVNYDNEDAGGLDEDVVFVDAQAHYQLTPSTKVFATAGYADVDEDQFGRDNFFASSLNLNVQF
ncbi:porin [Aquisalimonas sp. 2447]|uniref:porin n=1 Tax=Aquisalimonas sp. 2447 TaxID=2740807 RepID=UPI0014327E5E|nr:porin [Aquisalimonas sp. 2447]QIT56742.1 porin [Aquisalimonas sp. 2447]